MQTEIKDINQCVKELTITVPKEEAKTDYLGVIKEFKNYVVVPGYRKGKAPLAMVNSMFGNKIKESYLSDKLADYYKKALEDNDINPLFEPEVVDVKWEPEQELVAVFRYEIAPQIEVTKYTGLEIPFNPIVFEEDMIDRTIEGMRKQQYTIDENYDGGVTEDCQVALSGRFTSEDKADTDLPPDLISLSVKDHKYGEELTKAVLGAKKDDEIETVVRLEDNEQHPVKLNVVKVLKIDIPELNEDYAKEQGYDSLEDMKNSLKTDIQENIEKENQKNKIMSINMALISENPFDLPPTAIMQFSRRMTEPYAEYYNRPAEELAKEYFGIALHEMKTYYIMDNLLETVDLEPSEEDEQNVISEMANELNLKTEEFLERNPDVTKQDDFVEKVRKHSLYRYLETNNSFVWNADMKEESEETKEENSSQEAAETKPEE